MNSNLQTFIDSIDADAYDYIIELSNAFYIDNNNKELTNSQLQYIAYKTNKHFGTEYTDDDVSDLIYLFIKGISEWTQWIHH